MKYEKTPLFPTSLRLTEKAAVFLYGLDRKTIWEFQER